jgi:ectoine hydroxylase-related dioxygenase (phytanoyl-CoA dioxygenase family)
MASQPINLSNAQLDQLQAEFAEQGYVVLPNVIGQADRTGLVEQIRAAIEPLVGPAEFEADVGYPGAP